MHERCYLVYALAPAGVRAEEANEALNAYVAEERRGVAVWHDHFVGDHGGAVVLEIADDEQRALVDDHGPLTGWRVAVHPLTFSLTAVGFAAQASLTLEEYRGVSLEELSAQEPDDPRYWWKRRSS